MFDHEYTAQLILRRMNRDHYSIEYILLSLQSDSNTCSAVKSDVWTWIHSTADSETHERRSLQHRVHPSVFTERLKHMFCCKIRCWSWIHSTTDSETHEQRSLQHRVHPSVFTERLKHMFCCKIRCLNMNTQHSWFWDAWEEIITASSTSFCLYRATQTHVLL